MRKKNWQKSNTKVNAWMLFFPLWLLKSTRTHVSEVFSSSTVQSSTERRVLPEFFSEASKNIHFTQVRKCKQQRNQPYSSSSSPAVMKLDPNKVGSPSCVCFCFLFLWTYIMLPEISSR